MDRGANRIGVCRSFFRGQSAFPVSCAGAGRKQAPDPSSPGSRESERPACFPRASAGGAIRNLPSVLLEHRVSQRDNSRPRHASQKVLKIVAAHFLVRKQFGCKACPWISTPPACNSATVRNSAACSVCGGGAKALRGTLGGRAIVADAAGLLAVGNIAKMAHHARPCGTDCSLRKRIMRSICSRLCWPWAR